ncbi:phosphopantetheine-binding protein [Streptomyces sp. NPDC088812]|uniref:phosphopantetheine-binding protein n=1 Tax=Streptomyces sp. NPDC088812 TaxID=3365905 RepID=UPI0038214B94
METTFTELLRPHLRFLPDDQPVTEETPLPTMGLTSMQAIELMFDIEDAYGITLDDEYLNDATFATARSLWQAVEATRDRSEAA